MIRQRLQTCVVTILLGVVAATAGCTGDGTSADARDQKNSRLGFLVKLHTYAIKQLRHPPRSECEFKEFVAKQDASMFERMNVASADELFVSDRDGKPYVVIYGKPPVGAVGIVAYESEGVDGVREVGFDTGDVLSMTAEEFAKTGL